MSTEERVARLEGIIEQINARLDSIDARIGSLDARLSGRLNSLTMLLVGTWITTIITILGVGAALFFK